MASYNFIYNPIPTTLQVFDKGIFSVNNSKSGNQGVQGVPIQGIQGYQGYQGIQGIQGYQGYQGYQGIQGYQGFQGLQGIQGIQGFQGRQGFQGFQGYQGRQGFQGFQGNQGILGFQGIQGGLSNTVDYLIITGDLTVDTTTLKVDSTNNVVGIGTSTPTSGFGLDIVGYLKTYQICCRLYKNWSDASVAGGQSLISTDATVTADFKPSTLSSFGYITSGTYSGMYRAPVAGLYEYTVNVRFTDSTSSAIGIQVYRYNGSTFTNVLPGDGLVFASNDGSNRRQVSYTDLVSITSAGIALYPQQWSTCNVSNCVFIMRLVYAY